MREMCYRCMQPEVHSGRCRICGAKAWRHSDQDDPDILPPGTLLDDGNVMVGIPLGRGGFGVTYIARDKQTGIIALKEFFPKHMTAREGKRVVALDDRQKIYEKCKKDFQREARLIHSMAQHPNVVNVYFTLEENNTCYYGMELLQGCSLSTYLSRHGAMNPEDAIILLDPIMDALERMHKEKMLHRDISPDNIFLREAGNGYVPCLIDFGAAYSARQDFTQTMPRVKNMCFSPPDQNFSLDQQGPPMDIYALCATLYYMLCGKLPISSDERVILGLPLVCITEYKPSVTQTLWEIIKKGMSLERGKRYQTVGELRAELRKQLPPEALERLKLGVKQEKSTQEITNQAIHKRRSLLPLLSCMIEWIVFFGIPLVFMHRIWFAAVMFGFALYSGVNMLLVSIPPYRTLGNRLLKQNGTACCAAFSKRMVYSVIRAIPFLTLTDELCCIFGIRQDSFCESLLDANEEQEDVLMECLQMIEEDNLPVGPYYIMPLGPEQNFILGRGTELITEHATLVSREHCIIRYTDEGTVLYDNGSRNGTKVNNQSIPSKSACTLHSGDMIDLGGQITFKYEVLPLKVLNKQDTLFLKSN